MIYILVILDDNVSVINIFLFFTILLKFVSTILLKLMRTHFMP